MVKGRCSPLSSVDNLLQAICNLHRPLQLLRHSNIVPSLSKNIAVNVSSCIRGTASPFNQQFVRCKSLHQHQPNWPHLPVGAPHTWPWRRLKGFGIGRKCSWSVSPWHSLQWTMGYGWSWATPLLPTDKKCNTEWGRTMLYNVHALNMHDAVHNTRLNWATGSLQPKASRLKSHRIVLQSIFAVIAHSQVILMEFMITNLTMFQCSMMYGIIVIICSL